MHGDEAEEMEDKIVEGIESRIFLVLRKTECLETSPTKYGSA